ncbi:hypothetical protein K443DRAFT_685048 [Laccaria amethystina LaAM-08-1]|uniref:Uncharacterized protein n=1 Tax=Laccaria amethystina LaAM-08-1 TaxID=1095629 RepID=A0A0C9X8X1_9AGAR|nr:hypothetical protein K443DRAFT_685048 [Laccaria amethystina LaAM-08-1]
MWDINPILASSRPIFNALLWVRADGCLMADLYEIPVPLAHHSLVSSYHPVLQYIIHISGHLIAPLVKFISK